MALLPKPPTMGPSPIPHTCFHSGPSGSDMEPRIPVDSMYWRGRCTSQPGTSIVITNGLNDACQCGTKHSQDCSHSHCGYAPLTWVGDNRVLKLWWGGDRRGDLKGRGAGREGLTLNHRSDIRFGDKQHVAFTNRANANCIAS